MHCKSPAVKSSAPAGTIPTDRAGPRSHPRCRQTLDSASIAIRRSDSVNEGARAITVNTILEPSRATRRQARSTPSLSGVQQRTSEWFNASNDASLNGKAAPSAATASHRFARPSAAARSRAMRSAARGRSTITTSQPVSCARYRPGQPEPAPTSSSLAPGAKLEQAGDQLRFQARRAAIAPVVTAVDTALQVQHRFCTSELCALPDAARELTQFCRYRHDSAGQRAAVKASSKIATARVQPADAPRILCGKQLMKKPSAGSASRLCSFSRWQ